MAVCVTSPNQGGLATFISATPDMANLFSPCAGPIDLSTVEEEEEEEEGGGGTIVFGDKEEHTGGYTVIVRGPMFHPIFTLHYEWRETVYSGGATIREEELVKSTISGVRGGPLLMQIGGDTSLTNLESYRGGATRVYLVFCNKPLGTVHYLTPDYSKFMEPSAANTLFEDSIQVTRVIPVLQSATSEVLSPKFYLDTYWDLVRLHNATINPAIVQIPL